MKIAYKVKALENITVNIENDFIKEGTTLEVVSKPANSNLDKFEEGLIPVIVKEVYKHDGTARKVQPHVLWIDEINVL